LNEDLDKNLKTNKEEIVKLKREDHLLSIKLNVIREKSQPLTAEIENLRVMIPNVKDKISLLLEDLDKIHK
jgi:plasmid replication initiation protein